MILAFCVLFLLFLPLRVDAQNVDIIPVPCTRSNQADYDFQAEPAAGFSLHWKLSQSLETASFRLFDIIAPNARQQAIFDADMPGWVAIGFSPDGGMFSSDAVVGIPSQGTATEYDLDSKLGAFLAPSPDQEVTNVIVEKANGRTQLAFTRRTDPEGEGKQTLSTGDGSLNTLIWAFGPQDAFGYHFEGRGAISISLVCTAVADDPKMPSLTPSPVGIASTLGPTAAPTPASFFDRLRQNEEYISGGVRCWTGSIAGVVGLVAIGTMMSMGLQ